jgi:hypothetical protein
VTAALDPSPEKPSRPVPRSVLIGAIVVGFVVIFARCSFSTGSSVVMFGIEPWLSSEE